MMTKCHVGSWVGAQNKKKDISEKLRKKKKKSVATGWTQLITMYQNQVPNCDKCTKVT